jgi:hypothetical protein
VRSESRTTLGTGLSAATYSQAGMAESGIAGYIGGGSAGGLDTTVDKFAFSADSRTTLATGLSAGNMSMASFANSGTL